ncbi:MAG: hypothetical protein UZ01_01686 [Candidatus Brocadia sinica]|nr:MAG: hypothetical protein UZ01_01686 [Candidatus Brocadia sinica]MCK6466904.1 hypothetical protein [Candidatus Brocadia sinica]
MDKYDKILSQLLTKFYTNSKVEEEVRSIVKEIMNAEMSKLDKGRARGIKQEIRSIIEKEAESVAKKKKK